MFTASLTPRLVRGCLLLIALVVLGARAVRADILLFYDFDDDSDPLLAVDETGNGNDGIISGNDLDLDGVPDTPAIYTEPGLGRSGAGDDRAIDFLTTAEGTYITVPSAAAGAFDSLTANDAATVTMWLLGSESQPVNQWNFWFGPNRQLGSHVPWSDGTIYFDVAGCCAGNQRLQQGEPDSTKWKTEWNHYAFVKELDVTRIYQNGLLWAEGTGKSPLGPITEVFFGAGDSTHVSNYNGLMDDIGVWDQALTEDEIVDVMENGVGPPRPISLKRDIPDTLVNGTSGVVTIQVLVRVPGSTVVINEKMPAGLTASNPSNNGVLAGDTITWNLGQVNADLTLRYTMTAARDALNAKLPSTATVDGAPYGIGGDTAYTGSSFTSKGFIRLWNHLGPLAWAFPSVLGDHGPPGACDANGGVELAVDWIVNEAATIDEQNIIPFPGLITRPNYGGDGIPGGTGARAAGLVVEAGDTGAVVQDRFPAWKGTLSKSDTIDHASREVNGIDAEDHLTLSVVYVTNHTNAAIETNVGIGSDDSIQIFVGDVDITLGGQGVICRGWGAANEEQGVFPATLAVGENRVLVKVTDGCCASGFRLRFQDLAGEPDPVTGALPGLLPPVISVSLESALNPVPGSFRRAFAKDTYGLGENVAVSVEIDLKVAADLIVKESLPVGAVAAAISDGGTLNGQTIEWRLTGVQKKSVSYQVSAPLCPPALVFGPGIVEIGQNAIEISGPNRATRVFREDNLGVWTSRDIGTAGGAAERLGDHELLVQGAGRGVLLSTMDDFRFISVPASGDFEIATRIDCMDDANRRGLAGIMVRNSDDAGAANVFFSLSLASAAGFEGVLKATFRNDEAKPTRTLTFVDDDVTGLPIYLKMTRVGAKISMQRSPDGASYTEVASRDIVNVNPTNNQVNLAADVLIGIAATGGLVGNSVRANFDQVSGPAFSELPQGKTFRRGDADDNAQLQLTDAVRILSFLFLGQAAPGCLDAADADDNGQLQLTDAVRILGFLFLGGLPPADPGPTTCGLDVVEEAPDLGCVTTGCP